MITKTKVVKTKQSLVKALDIPFSKFIRLRDTPGGVGRCISCQKVITYKTCDCGHYINRKHMTTRYDEKNCNAQCLSCNRFDEGNIQGYRKGLLKKIGEYETDLLEVKKHGTSTMGVFELGILIKVYKQKVKEYENL